MISSFSIDTNILIYSVDGSNRQKHEISGRVLRAVLLGSGPLPLQCLSEFYRATTRKGLLATKDAFTIVQQVLGSVEIVAATSEDLVTAMDLHRHEGLQFFDSLLIAAVLRAGCDTLFTEDMQHGRVLHGLTFLNPFLLSLEELNSRLS